jgi:imidazolonepropionase-like amidohydrolase
MILSLTLLAAFAAPALCATPRVHAIVGARVVVAPGQVIEHCTIVMRDGVISSVGPNVTVPADARVWRGDSLTIYAGLIDPFVQPSGGGEPSAAGGGRGPGRRLAGPVDNGPPRGAAHELPTVHPELRAISMLPLGASQLDSLRAAGFTVAQLAPRSGIVRGQSAVIALGDGAVQDQVIRPDAAQVISLETAVEGYPGSLMGAIAVVRQALMDAKWYRDATASYAKSPVGRERPEENLSWAAMEPLVSGKQSAWFLADDMLEVLRSAAIAKEAGISATVVGGGDEYKRAKDIAAAGVPLVVPVNFPDAPALTDAANALEVSTEELRQWRDAPANAAVLAKRGIPFALTANGLKDPRKFRTNVGAAIERGLDRNAALAAMTTTPAKLLGLADRLGTIATGKIANLTVTRGDLFSDKGKVVEVWVDGVRYETHGDDATLKGKWALRWEKSPDRSLVVSADRDTTVKLVVEGDTLAAHNVRYEGDRLRFQVQRDSDPAEEFDLWLRDDLLRGQLSLANSGPGAPHHDVVGVRIPEEDKRGSSKKAADIQTPVVMGESEAWRMSPPAQPAVVLVRNATVWTAGPKGNLTNADVLIKAGKIAAVGKGLSAPSNALVIDGTGKHVAPGIIDEHSHAAIVGNVNECTNSVTCEVRIQDVVNSESPNIYRQLAGGTTIMHLLHGSCNAIGGQCAVIKNKWGAAPDELIFKDAPPTVKFALGENPKRSNFDIPGMPNRYPATRSGVEQVIRDAFLRAQDYKAALAEAKSGKRKLPVRRDLQLDALAEILDGKRLVHCHSYRQDEILMLMRLAESFGFRINTFTHVLEGYKVADELAAHGASALGFTDWWAYKFEVYDAIPYNEYIMWDRGVNTGFNSDDPELARRLNTEAAKAVKYGGVPPEEAIKFVTLNPAKSLKIENRVGSLEVGKDADFSIWSGSPLSPTSTCEQTWIEGRKYFDRNADLAGRASLAKERDDLIAAVRAAKKGPDDGRLASGGRWPPRYLEDGDLSGSDCQGNETEFMSEAKRRALQAGEGEDR